MRSWLRSQLTWEFHVARIQIRPRTLEPQRVPEGYSEISPRILDRFGKDKDPVRLTRVEPLVVEVSADVAWS